MRCWSCARHAECKPASNGSSFRRILLGIQIAALAVVAGSGSLAMAQQLADATAIISPPGMSQGAAPAAPQQHPLVPALELAYQTKKYMDANLKDYTATVAKQERIDGKLGNPEYATIKVRQHPFSVYMGFIAPADVKGQECMYVEGQNDGKMYAHAPPGTLRGKFGTVQLLPTSAMAMKDQRYPLTEIGIYNLTNRLIEVGEHDKQYGECDVKFFQGAKVNGRDCTMVQCVHPVPRRQFLFNMARIYLDTQLNVPIRYEAYDWPAQEGGAPQKLEEYTYMNLKINPGLTDADFDPHNPAYSFNVK
jgi:hypothetical protein